MKMNYLKKYKNNLNRGIIFLFFIFFFIISNLLDAQTYTQSGRSPVVVPDTSKIHEGTTELPTGYETYFSPEQDTAFFRAMRYRIPPMTRIINDLIFSSRLWQMQSEISSSEPFDAAMKRMEELNPDVYKPNPIEVVHHRTKLQEAFYVPHTRTYNPDAGLTSFHAIGKLIGLVEDVSPVIRFRLDYGSEVEIVIYSMQAAVISTLFKGWQGPGTHTITWNFRNDEGKLMPPGDYIAEVRIGRERYIRKRIVISR